jgi:diguanylate cyclase (GGDEF)-like protein
VNAPASTHAPRAPRQHDSARLFPAVAVGLLLVSLPLWWLVAAHDGGTDLRTAWTAGVLLCLAFIAGELFPLRVEVRRQTVQISLSELPLVIGLLTAPPWVVGLAHLAAGGLVYLFRRDSWRYAFLNLTLILAETGVAALVAQLVEAGPVTTSAADRRVYLAVTLGVLAASLVSAVLVAVLYRMLGPAETVRQVVTRSMVPAVVVVTVSLVAFTTYHAGQVLGPTLCVALAVVLTIVYRTYRAFLREHADLAKMYSFGRQVTGLSTTEQDWPMLLEQIRDQLNAEAAVLYLDHGTPTASVLAVGPDGPMEARPADPDDPLLAVAAATGRAKVSSDRTSEQALQDALDRRGAWDLLVVPLRSGDRDRGYLEVRDRRSRWGRYTEQDLTLLETLAGSLATALDNLRLVDTLRHAAYLDTITSLRNRLGFTDAVHARHVHESETAGDSRGRPPAVLLLDLDVLSSVNNALGHDRGEDLLRMAGHRLQQAAGAGVLVARIEGDRFAVLLEPAPEVEQLAEAARLRAVAGAPYSLDGIEVDPSATAGVAEVDDAVDHSGQASVVLQRAEMAMLAARSRDEPLQAYRSSMGEVFRRRFQLVTQFRQAVVDGKIIVHYQPKLRLADREVIGAEALVRWEHPEYGPVSPAEFVEAIEATGSIDILLQHVLDIVLAQINRWTRDGRRLSVSVNLSMRNLLDPDFLDMVSSALERHEVDPHLVTFEITESSVMTNPERSLPALRQLAGLGVSLSVDDFGTGYSSLAYLRRLPIEEIKIDRSFVQGMGTDLGDLSIVRAIVDLGHSLHLRVVAEGVEEEATRDALLTMQCDEVQGFLLARPMPLDRFEAWLESRTVSVAEPDSSTWAMRLMQ